MARKPHPTRHLASVLALLVAGALTLVLTAVKPAYSDDTELLRKGAADPFLFILLDDSTSMDLGFDGQPLPGYGENPDSRIYAAKRALYEVFSSVSNVDFGFAGYNQDHVRAVAKHWLYFTTDTSASNADGKWPIAFPLPETDGALTVLRDTPTIDTNADGIADAVDGIPDTLFSDIQGNVLTLGTWFNIGTPGVAASCSSPLDLDTPLGLQRAQAFAIQGSGTTEMWVSRGTSTYLLEISRPGNRDDGSVNSKIGQGNLQVHMSLSRVASGAANCLAGGSANFDATYGPISLKMSLDPNLNQYFVIEETANRGATAPEATAGLWDWSDVVQDADFSVDHPFTGKGWEGNYDSNHSGLLGTNPPYADADCYRVEDGCIAVKPTLPTVLSPLDRPLDRGDVLPFDWTSTNKDDFLRRVSPSHPLGAPDYESAPYFQDTPTSFGTSNVLLLNNGDVRPTIAVGISPLNKSINDFRCFYLGTGGVKGTQKCGNSAFFTAGWDTLACKNDASYGCRRPFLVIISDGEANAGGESPVGDIGSLNTHAGVVTWVINVGPPKNCTSGTLNAITNSGGTGKCVNATDPTILKQTLQSILGEIVERSRSFASAAVPSVQVSVQDQVYVTNFTPVQSQAYWAGHVHAFLKPIPDLNGDGRPDIDLACSPSRDFECHLWDAGDAMLTQSPNPAEVSLSLKLGNGTGQRRVFYSLLPDPTQTARDTWPENRRLFDRTDNATPEAIRYDLWRGLGLISPATVTNSLTTTQEDSDQTAANAILGKTLVQKSATLVETGQTITYVLGDIFHSNPTVVGAPANVRFFAEDLNGYRQFATEQEHRRQMIIMGTNEGMFHAFDAGRFHVSGTDPITSRALDHEFDNGSGKELFAYVPRTVMPRIRTAATSTNHQFTVDGTVQVFDVFVDPRFSPSVTPQRSWRTVAVGGLREGGQGYYALDITQPDPVTEINGDFIPSSANYVPTCIDGGTGCGPVPFGTALWEFTDSVYDSGTGLYVQLDEDDVDGDGTSEGNGTADLADTWSIPNIGRIQVCPDATCATPEDRYVAVFGGGMDASTKADPVHATKGNWLYMVDIETGQAIYKRQLVGAAPSEPAAVDTDQNGYIDRIYIGTLAGKLYRVDLGNDPVTGKLPVLTGRFVLGLDKKLYRVLRIPKTDWQPKVIFDTNFDGSTMLATASPARAIYQRPSVLFVARLGLYAIAFGTGDREDLWSTYSEQARFYIFVDDSDNPTVTLPMTEADFHPLDLTSTPVSPNSDFLLDPTLAPGSRGWFLRMTEDDRLVTDPFSLSGVTIFSAFRPDVAVSDSSGGTVTIDKTVCGTKTQPSGDTTNTCAKRGFSRIFVLNTTNGNGYLTNVAGDPSRFREIKQFVTNPFAEQAPTRNKTSNQDNNGDGTPDNSLTVDQKQVMESLKSLFPKNCKFASYRIDVKTITDDTQVELIAPIPVCVIEKNWKEF